jgi:hypothetical protein
MEKVAGIGGVFFRARDPKALADWYEKNLGITKTPTDYGLSPWFQAGGPTYGDHSSRTPSTFPAEKCAMWNFRVKDLGRDGQAAARRRHRGGRR